MGAVRPEVADVEHEGRRQLLLDIQRELLGIRRVVVKRGAFNEARRRRGRNGCRSTRGVVQNRGRERVVGHSGWIVKDRRLIVAHFRRVIGPAIAASERGFAVAEEVISETETRREVVFVRMGDLVAERRRMACDTRAGLEDQAIHVVDALVVGIGVSGEIGGQVPIGVGAQ